MLPDQTTGSQSGVHMSLVDVCCDCALVRAAYACLLSDYDSTHTSRQSLVSISILYKLNNQLLQGELCIGQLTSQTGVHKLTTMYAIICIELAHIRPNYIRVCDEVAECRQIIAYLQQQLQDQLIDTNDRDGVSEPTAGMYSAQQLYQLIQGTIDKQVLIQYTFTYGQVAKTFPNVPL